MPTGKPFGGSLGQSPKDDGCIIDLMTKVPLLYGQGRSFAEGLTELTMFMMVKMCYNMDNKHRQGGTLMEFHVYENARAACEAAGVLIAAQITRKGDSVLGLATGSTPIPAYEMLVQWYERGVIDFDRIRTFNLDEYVGIDHKNPLSYHAFMDEHLFSKVNIRRENVHLPSGNAAADGEAYDKAIHQAGGIDIQLLGIGRNGHIGFNEPDQSFTYGTHVVTLTPDTIQANARFFKSADEVPRQAISMGIGNIMSAKCVVLVATGVDKANAVYKTICGPITPEVPASILQLHPCCVILADREAASLMQESL